MDHTSLFGHLVTRFSVHPENLATEALNYVLGRSRVARQAFADYLGPTGIGDDNPLTFRTQALGVDGAIPDLVGATVNGTDVVIVEAKFWAGLTDNQPLTYLERLPRALPSVLLFVAPGARLATLLPELKARCAEGGLPWVQERAVGPEFVIGALADDRVLALTSWRALLGSLTRAVSVAGEAEVLGDLVQLHGLCERMDNEAFLPLESEELTGDSGRRVAQFCDLVDDVTRRAVTEGLADIKNLRQGSGNGYYGRYMRLGGHNAFLAFNAKRWARVRSTPLWLSFLDERWSWRVVPDVRLRLRPLEQQDPTRLLVDEGHLTVPIVLPLGVERDRVIEAVLQQVREVGGLLRGGGELEDPRAEP